MTRSDDASILPKNSEHTEFLGSHLDDVFLGSRHGGSRNRTGTHPCRSRSRPQPALSGPGTGGPVGEIPLDHGGGDLMLEYP